MRTTRITLRGCQQEGDDAEKPEDALPGSEESHLERDDRHRGDQEEEERDFGEDKPAPDV